MRKHLLSFFATCAAISGASSDAAATELNAEFQWLKTLAADVTTCNTDAVVAGPDGDYYLSGNVGVQAGTNTPPAQFTWGDENLIPSAGFSFDYQKDALIARMGADGTLVWNIVPSVANFAANATKLAMTADGGLVMATNATFNKAGANAPLLVSFTDTKGNDVNITWEGTPAGIAPYTGLIVKFSANGEYRWHRLVTGALYADEDNTIAVTSPVTVNTLATDAQGNIFIGGSYITSVDFGNDITAPKALNATIVNGKASTNCDGFIAKYSSDGTPLGVLTNGGTEAYATSEAISAIAVEGDKLYCAALVSGLAGATYTLFGNAAEVSETVAQGLTYGEVDCATLECTRANGASAAFSTSNQKSHVLQIKNLQAIDGSIYVNAGLNGALEQNGKEIATAGANQIQPLTLTIDATTMDVTASYMFKDGGIGVDFYTIVDKESDTLYAYGYTMSNGSPCALRSYNLSDGTLIANNALFNGGTVFTAVFNNDTKQFICNSYAKSVSAVEGAPADFTSPSYTNFSGFLLSFRLPGINAALSGAEAIAAIDGNNDNAPVEYFNMQGIRISNPTPGTLVIKRQGTEVSKIVAGF